MPSHVTRSDYNQSIHSKGLPRHHRTTVNLVREARIVIKEVALFLSRNSHLEVRLNSVGARALYSQRSLT